MTEQVRHSPIAAPASPAAGRRLVRLLALVAALVLALGAGGIPVAHAATGDRIDSFTAEYVVDPSGIVHVTETIVFRFGSDSGRHGIDRQYVIREPWGDTDQDAVYTYSNIRVTSPSGAPASFERTQSSGGRNETMRLRIGDANRTVTSPTATYQISYDLAGALRTADSVEQLYWDVTGNFSTTPATDQVRVTVRVPQAVAGGVACFVGDVGAKDTCARADLSGNTATFEADDLSSGEGLTIAVKVAPGSVANPQPTLVERGDAMTPVQQAGMAGVGVLTLASLVLSPILGRRWWQRNGRDLRFTGMPPGTIPPPGTDAPVGPSDPDLEIPVAFSPPDIPVAEAGMLVDGQIDTRETTATIVSLATRGVLRIEAPSEDEMRATLVDPSRTETRYEVQLLQDLFRGAPPGAVAELTGRGELATAHQNLATALRQAVAERGWFVKTAVSKRAWGGGTGAFLVLGAIGLFNLGPLALALALPLAPILITVAVVKSKAKRGQRTPLGRALTDQVEGFRTYLATAEADQLRFEEGEDIFSRYLPWAIQFNLADRWARICQQLVAEGRLPDTNPAWFYGNVHWTMFNYGMMSSAISQAATPVSSETSGTGFGGGSGFGGGGFSGGGGGGGGTSSW